MSSDSIVTRWRDLLYCIHRLFAALAGVTVVFQRGETAGQLIMELVKSCMNSGHRTVSMLDFITFSFTGITVE